MAIALYIQRDRSTCHMTYRTVLCDFGDAQFGGGKYCGDVMPDLYRAPEIVLGIPWDEKIDIWSVGLMVSRTPFSVGTSTDLW